MNTTQAVPLRLKTERVNSQRFHEAVHYIRLRDRERASRLNRKRIYIKPRWGPFAGSVWATKNDIFLPWNFNSMSKEHQLHNVFIATALLQEQEDHDKLYGAAGYILWLGNRMVSIFARRLLRFGVRKAWARFVRRTRL